MSPANDSATDPAERLLDLILYAPLGLAAKASESFPDLAARGRRKATNARVVGQFALAATNSKAKEAFAEAEQHIAAFFAIVADSARPSSGSPSRNSDGEQDVTLPASQPAVSVDGIIAGYDSRTAAQILPLLAALTPEQLATVERHERGSRARKTILNRIRQLQG